MDGLIFLSGTSVFSTEQQPGSVLVPSMGERGELLCTLRGNEQAFKGHFRLFAAPGGGWGLGVGGHVAAERTEVGDS